MDTVRIGCVKYLNTLPLIEGLASWREAELISAVPSRLIDLLLGGVGAEGGERGEVDVALVSLIDYARSPEPLAILPVGMIGCDGPTMTVRLYSSVEPEKITAVHGDTDSHTSATLVRVVLAKRYGRVPELIDFDARERVSSPPSGDEWPPAMVLIGDKIVTDAPPAERYPHQVDLGQAWKEMTGLPFVYAAWMCRASALDDESDGGARKRRILAAAAVLDRARRHNATRLDWIVAGRAAERGWPEDVAATYVGSYLRYEVGERERAAAERFLEEAASLGLAPRREVRWVEV